MTMNTHDRQVNASPVAPPNTSSGGGTPIRVLIADDHEAVRSGVAAILGTSPSITIVGEAENGIDAVARCHDTRPDVALVDLRMPGRDGIWATERITAETATRVLVLTTFDSDELVAQALAAGAHGYLLKSTGGTELIRAVEHVAGDRHVLDPAIAGSVISAFTAGITAPVAAGSAADQLQHPGTDSGTAAAAPALTERERDVLLLLTQGLTNQQIADTLHIGLTTVKTHVGALYTKSGAVSRVQLAQFRAG